MALSRQSLLVCLLSVISSVCADDARISSIPDPPMWQLESLMHLQLTPPETEALRLTYSVYPLTESAGLNRTQEQREAIWIRGSLVPALLPPDSERLASSETIALLSCDAENSSATVNTLMAEKPMAILLYSIDGNCCTLKGNNLSYSSIYSMTVSGEANDIVNTTFQAGGVLRATITGTTNNVTSGAPAGTQEQQSGSNSAVAMSVLYSVTGLVTLLFLVIIGTGAIRAHRYPERYGPRSGVFGGQPRQSRAKGLARAVLETLPIVKYGKSDPVKPDPAFELESQSGGAPDLGTGTRLSAIPEEPQPPQARRGDEAPPMSGAVPEVTAAMDQIDTGGPKPDGRASEEHLRCSICTEDFSVGEDVRVLPCNHKFHPPCIDPWLINISGTCPLFRLDLRPQDEQRRPAGVIDSTSPLVFTPPLAATADWNEHNADEGSPSTSTTTPGTITAITTINPQRRRSSRLLDLHRLRHASLDERIEILRRHASQQHQREGSSGGGVEGAGGAGTGTGTGTESESEEQRGRRAARITERLRDRFRIRTRTLLSSSGVAGSGSVSGSGPAPSSVSAPTSGSVGG